MAGISNEAINEVARNLFDGGDIDYTIEKDGSATINEWNLPDVDDYEYNYGAMAKETLDKAIELLTKLISNVKFYVSDNGANLELNDNHTLWDINAPDEYEGEFDYDYYQYLVDQALDEFEERTGVKAYQDGRMGRHIVIDITFDNMVRFKELKAIQEELEADVIEKAENECFPVVDGMTESLNKGEKKARCLSCGVDVIYTNKDVEHDIDGDYIECPNCHATFDVDYDNIAPLLNKKTESIEMDLYNKAINMPEEDFINGLIVKKDNNSGSYIISHQDFPDIDFMIDGGEYYIWLSGGPSSYYMKEKYAQQDINRFKKGLETHLYKDVFMKPEERKKQEDYENNKKIKTETRTNKKTLNVKNYASNSTVFLDDEDGITEGSFDLSFDGLEFDDEKDFEDYCKENIVDRLNVNLADIDEDSLERSLLTLYIGHNHRINDNKGIKTEMEELEEECTQAGAIAGPVSVFGQKKKKEETEDMSKVKNDVKNAVKKSDSTEQEKDQVKGSIDVLKTDEESAIAGYDEFIKETGKVVDKELSDEIDNQMQEIVDDEKEHIEKLDTIKSALGESKKLKTEGSSSINKANALLDLFNEVYDGMGDMYALKEWAEELVDEYNLDDDYEEKDAKEIISTALNKMDDKAFREQVDTFVDGLFENSNIDYLKDTLHIYPRNLKHIIQCLNAIKPYASKPDDIDKAISELKSVNLDLRNTAREFQEYLHNNYKPWTVFGTTTGPRTYVDLFDVPTEYDIVGADDFNYANRPNDMLENIGYGWKQEENNIVADLIGFTDSISGSSVVYDQAPVKYGFSATIDSSNKEEKFKEMANALISKAKEIKKKYNLVESKVTEDIKTKKDLIREKLIGLEEKLYRLDNEIKEVLNSESSCFDDFESFEDNDNSFAYSVGDDYTIGDFVNVEFELIKKDDYKETDGIYKIVDLDFSTDVFDENEINKSEKQILNDLDAEGESKKIDISELESLGGLTEAKMKGVILDDK